MAREMCMAVTLMLAAVVVQASQCASGSECTNDDEPTNPVSLLQTKLRMNVLGDGASMMKNPSAMLTELEGMVRSGETPAFNLITTIKSLIEDDIISGIQSTRDAAAQTTADALSAIQACNNASKASEASIEASMQVSVETARSLHAACREAQKVLYDHNLTDPDSYCVKLGKFLHDAHDLKIPDGSSRRQSVDYVKDASHKNLCDGTQVTELDSGCRAAEAELSDKEAECMAAQSSFESDFCTWRTQLKDNCDTLDTCHSNAVRAYQKHLNKTKILVEKWDVETAALHKILCYCNVWLSERDDGDNNRSTHNATQFEVCKDQTYAPEPVNYGTPAEKVACLLTAVENYPGTSGFITQEYSSCDDFVGAVTACVD